MNSSIGCPTVAAACVRAYACDCVDLKIEIFEEKKKSKIPANV